MKKIVKIGNAQGFWGDSPDAAALLLSQQPDLDYLTLDYLAEVSMSIMAIQREKDPSAGYARDFLEVLKSLIPFWQNGSKVKVVTNCGGLNPQGCAAACREILNQNGCSQLKIGVVSGDDVLSLIQDNPSSSHFTNLDSAENLNTISKSLVTANAYLGAKPIVEALQQGADIVITGRVADPSLTVAPCIAHFGWTLDDYDRIAGATIAGHLIECGTQVTGGIATKWLELKDNIDIGFPIVEVREDGSCIVTKPLDTGGKVDVEIVKEQLLYEIGDPDKYLSPDATVSFLSLKVIDISQNRVEVSGAKGKAPPSTYKVSATYRDGYRTEGMLTIFGHQAALKARKCGEALLERLKKRGYEFQRSKIECLGVGDVVSGVVQDHQELKECVLRVCVADSRKDALERFSKEFASLVTSGPQGVTGYISGRPKVRPVFGYWPCLIDVRAINPNVKILS